MFHNIIWTFLSCDNFLWSEVGCIIMQYLYNARLLCQTSRISYLLLKHVTWWTKITKRDLLVRVLHFGLCKCVVEKLCHLSQVPWRYKTIIILSSVRKKNKNKSWRLWRSVWCDITLCNLRPWLLLWISVCFFSFLMSFGKGVNKIK